MLTEWPNDCIFDRKMDKYLVAELGSRYLNLLN